MVDRFCRKQRPYFSDRLDGARLPFWRGLFVRFHLFVCPPCRRYNRSLEATQQVVIDLQRLITGHIVTTATAALTGRPGGEALVQALPEANGTAETTKTTTSKRKSGKSITAQFETLDVSQAPESEAASNGNGKHPFR